MPVGCAMDLHANLTEQLIAATNVTILYRTNPHLDALPRARECGEIVVRAARGEVRPVQAIETPPLVINIVKQFTEDEPMVPAEQVLAEMEAIHQEAMARKKKKK